MEKYRASLLMIAAALACVLLHLWFGWHAAIDEAATHGEAAEVGQYLIEWARDTFENLQSEFWQLAVQFALLAGFFEFMRVRAYEEDQEQIKETLARIESTLAKGD
jgi:hypothetical protein